MLLRVSLQNFFSFKEQTEFNLFPSSRTMQLTGHIVLQDYAKVLRMSAVYGANGAGKSNLVKAVSLVRRMVVAGTVDSVSSFYYRMPFLLDENLKSSPVSAALEFSHDGVIYYYTVSFTRTGVECEELYVSGKSSDELVFSRTVADDVQHIEFGGGFIERDPNNAVFAKALAEKILGRTDLLLSFMGEKYPSELPSAALAYTWFCDSICVLEPSSMSGITAHLLDVNPDMLDLLNRTLPEMRTGISKIEIRKRIVREDDEMVSGGG